MLTPPRSSSHLVNIIYVSCVFIIICRDTRIDVIILNMKLNEWGFRPPSCTYRLNCVRRTSWVKWNKWDDTALQTHNSTFEPWWTEHATSRSRRLSTILNHCEWVGKRYFVFLKLAGQSGVRTRDLQLSKQAALTTAPGCPPIRLNIHAQHI